MNYVGSSGGMKAAAAKECFEQSTQWPEGGVIYGTIIRDRDSDLMFHIQYSYKHVGLKKNEGSNDESDEDCDEQNESDESDENNDDTNADGESESENDESEEELEKVEGASSLCSDCKKYAGMSAQDPRWKAFRNDKKNMRNGNLNITHKYGDSTARE